MLLKMLEILGEIPEPIQENYFCIGAGNIDGLGKNSSSIGVYGRVRKENF